MKSRKEVKIMKCMDALVPPSQKPESLMSTDRIYQEPSDKYPSAGGDTGTGDSNRSFVSFRSPHIPSNPLSSQMTSGIGTEPKGTMHKQGLNMRVTYRLSTLGPTLLRVTNVRVYSSLQGQPRFESGHMIPMPKTGYNGQLRFGNGNGTRLVIQPERSSNGWTDVFEFNGNTRLSMTCSSELGNSVENVDPFIDDIHQRVHEYDPHHHTPVPGSPESHGSAAFIHCMKELYTAIDIVFGNAAVI
ncbi:uncharacterized protein EI90DRAFT_3018195 [Cantharellus anzutake]|uniref:uncharacterized protein n=1 Tax=Cantharellus anzutake TaxID=1750568 RepID=UPI0019055D5D|nr:uncharacterized protein EI90DRAFT_3018195 [Cantharellus anzutake]KAF8327459.1 hypothetical protein EI90DRAFT_3018195 [Cantharellus anzutake]